MIIVNGWKPLIIITKRSILDVAAALDPSLLCTCYFASGARTFQYARDRLSLDILPTNVINQITRYMLLNYYISNQLGHSL